MTGDKLAIRLSVAWLIAAICVTGVRSGLAVEVVFQLQGANSLLAAPYVEDVAMPMTAQDEEGAGLTTTYSGTITLDVDDLMNPTSITFVSASAAAANSGNWLPQEGGGDGGDPDIFGDANPGTPMPANYGFVLDLGGPEVVVFYGATRDTILSLNAASRAVTGGEFDPSGIGLTVTQGYFDANISSQIFPEVEGGERLDLADPEDPTTGTNCTDHFSPGTNSCGSDMGSYSVEGNTATLMLPLNFHIGGGTPVVQFTGIFIATASLDDSLPGDFNNDGKVDAADYTVIIDQNLGNDAYNEWVTNFGAMQDAGGNAAVPEPATTALIAVGLLGLWIGRRRLGR